MSDRPAWAERVKSLWTRGVERVYDEVMEDVEKEYKSMNDARKLELDKQNDEKSILSAHINELVVKNGKLVHENSELKHQVRKLESTLLRTQRIGSVSPSEQQDKTTPMVAATVSLDEYQHLLDNLNTQLEQHREMGDAKRYLERKNAAIMQKNQQMKESVKAWKVYSDRQRRKKDRVGDAELAVPNSGLPGAGGQESAPISSSRRSTTIKTPPSSTAVEDTLPAYAAPLAHGGQVTPPATTSGPMDNPIGKDTRLKRSAALSPAEEVDLPQFGHTCSLEAHPQSEPQHGQLLKHDQTLGTPRSTNTHAIPSSDPTEDEFIPLDTSEAFHVASPTSDDDVPQFVSATSLKRKRAASTGFRIHQDRSSSDGTPIKPRQVKEEKFSSPPLQEAQHLLRKETLDLDELGPSIIMTPRRRPRGNTSAHSHAMVTLQQQPSMKAPSIKEETVEQRPDFHLDNEDMAQQTTGRSYEARTLNEPSMKIAMMHEALQPLDPNVQTAHIAAGPQKTSTKRELQRERVKHSFLTEDGDELPPQDENFGKLTPNAARDRFNRKLKASKVNRTVEKPSTKTPTADIKPQSRIRTPPFISGSSARTNAPFISPGPAGREPTASASGSSLQKSAQRRSLGPPLRSKPISELNVSDFKANPKYNQGYSYAFSETVRKRADRACLPGCTRSECCGSTFRTLAETLPPLSESQEERLLVNYLGDAYDRTNLTQMSTEERKEIIMQARTRDIAQKHGRHKQAYERHTTPPGFWRTDFPTTQEDEEDRRKAEEMERNKVRDMWMEAMRKGGGWIFRDE